MHGYPLQVGGKIKVSHCRRMSTNVEHSLHCHHPSLILEYGVQIQHTESLKVLLESAQNLGVAANAKARILAAWRPEQV